ncbi:MAG: cob(I)yrinic acid a,c-diamide adenosyltransferase [Thermodesulfobacteriota bacterium]
MSAGEEARGLVLVNTGPGKGKTTAALGAALRAAGNGWPVLIVQFIKNRDTGELRALGNVPGVEIRQMGRGLIIGRRPDEEDRRAAAEAWTVVRDAAASGRYKMIVLDEIGPALKLGLVDLSQVLDFLRHKPGALHLVLTGRDCPEDVLAAADTVTRMESVKHHLAAGIKAQPGIEY